MQNDTISELHTDYKKHLATLMIFVRQLQTFIQKRQTCKSAIAELFSKTYKKKKISNKQFHHCDGNIFQRKLHNL